MAESFAPISEPKKRRTIRHRPRFLKRKTVGDVIFNNINGLLMILLCLSIIYPFWRIILNSFTEIGEANIGFRVWNDEWSLISYEFALSKYGNALVGYANSVLRVIVGTIFQVTCAMLLAYPLSKRDLPFRKTITLYVVITLFFSGGLIPLYILIRSLGLMDTRLSLILPTMANGFYIVIMRNFLMTLDNAYEESAMVDGANYFVILTRIVLPLSKPIIATIWLWSAVSHWNEWFHAMIFIRSRSKWVLQFLMRRMLIEQSAVKMDLVAFEEEANIISAESVRDAVAVLTIGPIILVYPFIQKYFIKGVFVGSLKG